MAVSDNIQTPNNNLPAVSVVIPTFNRAHLLPRAINSVLAQTFSDFELIIVDDGSTDNTAEVVAGFADSRIIFIPIGKNCGGSHARNQGIKAARAEYVAFLDSDDEWLPEKLELQIARFQASDDTRATVGYCLGYECYAQRQKLPSLALHEGDVFEHLLRGWLPPTTSLFMIQRSALLSVGGFDESLPSFQDYDLWLSLAAANNHFVAVDKPLIIRYFHDERIGGNFAASLEGLKIFQNKWSTTIKQKVGNQVYRQLMGIKTSNIQLIGVSKAIDRGDKIAAFKHSIALFLFLPWSLELLLKGLFLSAFGNNGYKILFQIKSAINSLIFSRKNI